MPTFFSAPPNADKLVALEMSQYRQSVGIVNVRGDVGLVSHADRSDGTST